MNQIKKGQERVNERQVVNIEGNETIGKIV